MAIDRMLGNDIHHKEPYKARSEQESEMSAKAIQYDKKDTDYKKLVQKYARSYYQPGESTYPSETTGGISRID